MSAAHHPEAPIQRYIAVVGRRIWVLVVFLVCVPAAAVGYSQAQSTLYEANSTVLINRQSVASQLSGSADVGLQQQSFQQVLVTQSRLARTPDVLRATLVGAGKVARGLSANDLRADSTVDANPDSDLLEFAVTRPDKSGAERLVLSYANAYVQYRRTLDSAALNRALRDVNSALAAAARRPSPATRSLTAHLATSRQQLETRLALQSANAQVVARPEGAQQVRPRPVRSGVLGLIVGLMLGLGAVFLRDALDTRVRTSSESEALLAVPIVSRIPGPHGARSVAPDLPMLEEPGSVRAEGFRILRTNLNFGLLSSEAKIVMVTSSAQGEGKSTTIANLAVAYALSGKRVALIDLDLRRPSLGRLFGVSGGPGVSGVALGQSTLSDALKPIELDRVDSGAVGKPGACLDLLTTGPIPPDPSEFISTDVVRGMVRGLLARYDLVLLDAPPLVTVSDTAAIAGIADAVFVCVRLGVAQRGMLTELRKGLDRLAIPTIGQVITGAERDGIAGYQGYYSYGASASDGSKASVGSKAVEGGVPDSVSSAR